MAALTDTVLDRSQDSTAGAGLSTAPVPVPAVPVPGVRRSRLAGVRRAWRQLTSMRTALLLLFLLAIGAVPGSLLPQRGLNPVRVSQYYTDHPRLAPVLDRLSLFDVFAAPWFAAIYLLLFVSLAGCLVPRLRLHTRALRSAPPAVPRHLDRLPETASWTTDADPAAAAESVGRILRRGRWRVVSRPARDGVVEISAERGYLRETGNLVFHVSLLVLLAGVAAGALFGYRGSVLVVEGDGFTNTVSAYDTFTPGRLTGPDALGPFGFTLDEFTAEWLPDGKPRTFLAELTARSHPDSEPVPVDLRVNDPLSMGGARTYLIGHGYAPRFVVRDERGDVAFDAAVPCLPQDGAFVSTCVVKVPDAQPKSDGGDRRAAQLGFVGSFTPDSARGPQGVTSVFPAARNPGVTLQAFRGDLGLDAGAPQSVYQLNTSRMTPLATAFLAPGETLTLDGGGSLTFVGVQEWASFTVAADPGKRLALVASGAIVVGLLLSLRVRRRRLWLRLSPSGAAPSGGDPASGRTVVSAGGLARTDAESFSAEFAAVRDRLGGGPTPDSRRPAGRNSA